MFKSLNDIPIISIHLCYAVLNAIVASPWATCCLTRVRGHSSSWPSLWGPRNDVSYVCSPLGIYLVALPPKFSNDNSSNQLNLSLSFVVPGVKFGGLRERSAFTNGDNRLECSGIRCSHIR